MEIMRVEECPVDIEPKRVKRMGLDEPLLAGFVVAIGKEDPIEHGYKNWISFRTSVNYWAASKGYKLVTRTRNDICYLRLVKANEE